MRKWTVFSLCLLYILTVANCKDSRLGQSCTTQSGTPGNFQHRLRCPSLQNNAEGSKDAAIVCCPHQTFTRSVRLRKTSTRTRGRKNTASTPVPNLRFAGCGEGGPTGQPRKARSIYDEETSADYESGENITDTDVGYLREFNMTTSMIVGGSQASSHSWPWMASLVERPFYSSRQKIFCCGTLISNSFVLSAAHCVKRGRRTRTDFSVRLGGHSLNDGTTHSVRNTYVPSNYRGYYNDLCLIRLREPVVFTVNVKPICLPTPAMASSLFEGQKAVITGWGTTSAGGPQSSVLKQATVSVVANKQCDRSYAGAYGKSNVITSNQICANSRGTDTCQGDSGGPLLLLDGHRKWCQIGVTSFGLGCAQLRYPGVYTRVGAYLPWMKSIMSSRT